MFSRLQDLTRQTQRKTQINVYTQLITLVHSIKVYSLTKESKCFYSLNLMKLAKISFFAKWDFNQKKSKLLLTLPSIKKKYWLLVFLHAKKLEAKQSYFSINIPWCSRVFVMISSIIAAIIAHSLYIK